MGLKKGIISRSELNRLEKIKRVKLSIKKFGEDTLKNIIAREKGKNIIFYRVCEVQKWLDKNDNYKNFTDEELRILGYKSNTGKITIEIEEKSEVKNKKEVGKIQEITELKKVKSEKYDLTVPLEELLTQEDTRNKFAYFLTHIDDYLGLKDVIKENLVIPSDLLKLESTGVTVRLWKKAIEEFNDFCNEHKNYTKIQLMSYALLKFVETYGEKEVK